MAGKRSGSRTRLTSFLIVMSACGPLAPLSELPEEAEDPAVYTAQTARPPSLTKLEPATVIAGSDTEVTITGRGFVPGLRVQVGGLLAPAPRTVTSTKIQVSLPGGLAAATAVPVRVTLPDGRYSERTDLFAVNPDPISLTLMSPRQRYTVPGARSPAVADFNQDGRPDIAAISATGASIVLFVSNVTGGALTPQPGPALADPYTMTTADLNRDGKADLIVTSRSGAQPVTVLLGNGDGTFKPELKVTAFTGSFSDFQNNHVTAGDLTGDGKPDLVIGDVGGNITVLPGAGDGTFGTGTALGTLPHPVRAVRIGDFDGNGAPEVAAASGILTGTGGAVLIAQRQMDGTWKSTHSSTSMDNYSALAILDQDADGKLDVAAVAATGKLHLYRGNGDGTLGMPVASDVGKNDSFLAAGDLNGDGRADLVSGGRFDPGLFAGQTFISLVNADGTTRSAQLEADGQSTGGVLADINRDGRLDLVLVNTDKSSLEIVFGRGDGSFVLTSVSGVANASTSGDFNGDGRLDLAYVGSGANKLGLLLGRGDGSFDPVREFDVDRAPSAVRTGDVNGDGYLDAVVTCYDTNLVSLLLGKGDGTFATQRTFSVGKGPNSLAVADLDGDGKLDVVTANTDGDSVSVLIGNGTGNFATNKDYAVGKAPVAVAAAELSGDGRIDVVTANAEGNSISYLQGSAVTAGTLNAAKSTATGLAPADLLLVDTNGDGKLDVITVNSDSNTLSMIAGRGDGTFVSARSSATCEFPIEASAGELTGDGKIDLVVRCAAGKRTQALIGIGDGSFASSPRLFPLGTALTVADVNADSKPDVLIFDSGSPLQVLLNLRK